MRVTNEEKHTAVELDSMLSNATAMADALEYYLIEGSIFRTVMVHRPHGLERITMSTGELLTLVNILQAKRALLTKEQNDQLVATVATIAHVRKQLHRLFHDMIVREIMSRLDSINWFLHDCENTKDGCEISFPSEMRNRQRIEEMIKALGNELSAEAAERIDRIDQRIRQITRPADFIWTRDVKEIYPQEPYWYLYLLPQ